MMLGSGWRNGSLKLFSLAGIPVFLHWSIPAVLILAAGLSGFISLKLLYILLASVLLIGIHEFGHALMVLLLKERVDYIFIHIIGGFCSYQGSQYFYKELLIALGGLFAQVILLIIASIVYYSFENTSSVILQSILYVFTFVNILVMAFNLIPFKGLDGHKIYNLVKWKYFR